MPGFKRRIVADIEESGGRHDEASIYDGPLGDPGLAGGAGSMSWEIHGDLASLVVAGPAAVIMEVLHPSVMDGVSTQSSFRTEPLRRAKNTLGYVLRTTFGSTEGATRVIEMVKTMHGRVQGTRADGVSYRALDPELIGCVHTCIPWAVMTAYDRYVRPLSVAEKDRYLAEQSVIGRMGGADWVPTSLRDLGDYVEAMRPRMAMNSQTAEFIDFLSGCAAGYETGSLERMDRRSSVVASMSLMPDWAQRLTGTASGDVARKLTYDPLNRLRGGVIRWAYPVLPCKEMALRRAGAALASPIAA